MSHVSFTVIDGRHYIGELAKRLPHAKTRIVIAAMVLVAGPKTDALFEELHHAVKRGVQVRVLMDNFTKLTYLNGLGSKGKKRLNRTLNILNTLHDLGAHVHYVGHIGLIPYRGRCHVKITIVDDEVFSFGGINFVDQDLIANDYMLHTISKPYADRLSLLVERLGSTRGAQPNEELHVEGASLLFDGGQPYNSLIYERACELASQATRAYYVSQWCPSGELAALLQATDTVYFLNEPQNMAMPIDTWAQAFDLKRYRIINSNAQTNFIHAKCILFELPSGKRAYLSGSHNFTYRGVSLGTQEVALHGTDAATWDRLYAYMMERFAGKN